MNGNINEIHFIKCVEKDSNAVPVAEVVPGLKIYCADRSTCTKLNAELNRLGFTTRVSCAHNIPSIYVVEKQSK